MRAQDPYHYRNAGTASKQLDHIEKSFRQKDAIKQLEDKAKTHPLSQFNSPLDSRRSRHTGQSRYVLTDDAERFFQEQRRHMARNKSEGDELSKAIKFAEKLKMDGFRKSMYY